MTLLDADRELRHLVVEAARPRPARFQVLVGAADAAAVSTDAVLGRCRPLVCYDALHDPELAALLLRGIAEQRSAGPLQFVRKLAAAPGRRGPARPRREQAADRPSRRTRSLVFGDAAILKVLRRLSPAPTPTSRSTPVAWLSPQSPLRRSAGSRRGSTTSLCPLAVLSGFLQRERRLDDGDRGLGGCSRATAYGEYLTVVDAGPVDAAAATSRRGHAAGRGRLPAGNVPSRPRPTLARRPRVHADMATASTAT